MKVILIGPTAPYKGGISHFNTLIYNALKKKHDVELISWKRRYPSFIIKEQLETGGEKIIKSDNRFILDSLNPLTWFKVFSIVIRKKPDMIIFHWVSTFMVPIFSIIAFLTRNFSETKVLLICHHILPLEQKPWDKILTKIMFKNVDYFITHSKEDFDELKKINKKANAKVGFMPIFPIFVPEKFDKKGFKQQLDLRKKVILFFGFVRKYKGLTYLIKAMPLILKEIDLDLLVVGEFWHDKEQYISLLNKLKIMENVKIIDEYVPDGEVGKYFSVADIVVQPYIVPTSSAVAQIALTLNKPVIVTTTSYMVDVVRGSKTGFVVEPKNSKALAEAIVKFFKRKLDKNFMKYLKNKKKRFSWENYIKLLSNF